MRSEKQSKNIHYTIILTKRTKKFGAIQKFENSKKTDTKNCGPNNLVRVLKSLTKYVIIKQCRAYRLCIKGRYQSKNSTTLMFEVTTLSCILNPGGMKPINLTKIERFTGLRTLFDSVQQCSALRLFILDSTVF